VILETKRRLELQDVKVLLQVEGLAALYLEQARYGDAEPLFLEEYQRREKLFGPDHAYTTDSLRQLVQLYKAWGKSEETEKWQARLSEIGVEF
jgi:hypothetical protein